MNPLKIQYELKKKGISQKALAKKLGVSDMTVSNVVRKKVVSDRIMRAISTAIGKDHRVVYPEYYNKPPARSTSKTGLLPVY